MQQPQQQQPAPDSKSAGPVYPPRFAQLVKSHELSPQVAQQLASVISNCEIVLLCDDSGSMASTIAEAGTGKQTTRWMELKRLVAVIIDYVTSINEAGLDLYFLNRGVVRGVKSVSGLQEVFSKDPGGGTPLIGALDTIYRDKQGGITKERQLLVVAVTDGEPSDGSTDALCNAIRRKPQGCHLSFAECTDRPEDMDYLDELDRSIPNFDNTDDYREELIKVKKRMGANFKFDFNDYVTKILLATFYKQYWLLDQANSGCCTIL